MHKYSRLYKPTEIPTNYTPQIATLMVVSLLRKIEADLLVFNDRRFTGPIYWFNKHRYKARPQTDLQLSDRI